MTSMSRTRPSVSERIMVSRASCASRRRPVSYVPCRRASHSPDMTGGGCLVARRDLFARPSQAENCAQGRPRPGELGPDHSNGRGDCTGIRLGVKQPSAQPADRGVVPGSVGVGTTAQRVSARTLPPIQGAPILSRRRSDLRTADGPGDTVGSRPQPGSPRRWTGWSTGAGMRDNAMARWVGWRAPSISPRRCGPGSRPA